MSIRISQNSFSKGILSPSLQNRVDLEQYSLGLKNLVNGIVLQEGCVQNRSGLEFVAKAKYKSMKSRLIPFVFNTSQNYIIEAGQYYFRFIRNGGYILDSNNNIYEISSPYTEAQVFEFDYVQQGDVLTITHKSFVPRELARIAHNNWKLTPVSFGSSLAAPGNIGAVYTGQTSSNTTTYTYVVTAVRKDTGEESKRSAEVTVTGHLEAYWTTSEKITLSWDAVENADEYNIYRSVNGIFGYVGTSAVTTFIDNNIDPDLKTTAPIYMNELATEYPACTCYYQQRKVYASSSLRPETFWASQTGTNNNFNISHPLNATDAINMSIYESVPNEIRHLIPFDDLIVLTSNSEWIVSGKDGIFSANPAPVAKIQSFYGASKIKPIISGSMVLFVQSGGNIVRDLGYNYLSDSYDGEELTLFANHLFEGRTIVSMAYSKEPNRVLWCVMDNGELYALTYNPKQKISAWHKHITQGNFESVCTVRENNEDIAYFIVKRNINSENVRYIERFTPRTIDSMEKAFFLDCALKNDFANDVTVVSGLEHLKNMKVSALLDYGAVEELQVDASGSVTLPYPARHVLIGLPYTFEFESLDFENSETIGLKKLINKVDVQILNSREDFFIQNSDGTITQNARSLESVNYPEKLFDKNVEFCPLNNADEKCSIKIIQKYPMPINIVALSVTLSLEEVEAR